MLGKINIVVKNPSHAKYRPIFTPKYFLIASNGWYLYHFLNRPHSVYNCPLFESGRIFLSKLIFTFNWSIIYLYSNLFHEQTHHALDRHQYTPWVESTYQVQRQSHRLYHLKIFSSSIWSEWFEFFLIHWKRYHDLNQTYLFFLLKRLNNIHPGGQTFKLSFSLKWSLKT